MASYLRDGGAGPKGQQSHRDTPPGSPDADYPQDDPHPEMTATVLAGAVPMSGWLSIAIADGGKWSG